MSNARLHATFLALVLGSLCALAAPPPIDSTQVTGTITGIVVNGVTRSPLAGAQIVVVGTTKGAIAKRDGKFQISGVPAGVVALKTTFVGFEPTTVNDVVVSPGKPVTVTIELLEQAIELQGVVVSEGAFRKQTQTITSTQRLSSEEVRRAPGVQEDVVRAVALLPGVAVTAAGRNDLAVRGGAPFENLFLVDNIEVPNINHFGSQGSTGGPLSIINIDFVRDVSLSTGGFGPRFGDRLSSVTNITLRDGNDVQFGGEVNLSATGFGVIGEGPIGDRGTFLFSARRSYLDLIFNLAGFGFVPEYYDFTGKLSYDLDDQNALSFLVIGALGTVRFNNDSADQRFENSRVAAPSQDQYFSGLTWRHLMTDGVLNVTLGRTFTAYRTTQQDSLTNVIFRNDSDEGESSLRADLTLLPSPTLELNVGAIAKLASRLSYDIVMPGFARRDSVGRPTPLNVDTTFDAFRAGLYAQAVWTLADRWKLSAGGRADLYPFLESSFFVSPRLGVSFQAFDNVSFNVSGGRYYQAPQFIWLIGDQANGSSLSPLRADQVIGGVEWIVAEDLKIQAEAYYKSYSNYPVRRFRPQAVLAPTGFDDITSDIPFGLEPISMSGTGTAMGVELFVQKKLSADIPVYGLASISINRTRFVAADGIERPGAFDTPIIATIAAGWRPDDAWELSGKVRASEGIPSTPFIATPEQAAASGFPIGTPDFMRYNEGGRLPFFYAVDVRVDKRWFFSGWQLITYIDVQNVTARKNVSGQKWNQRLGQVELQESIGVLPSIGVNIEF